MNKKLTNKYKNVNQRVGDCMGGKVLDLDIIKAHDAGKSEGYAEGHAEGHAEGRAEGIEEDSIIHIRNIMSNLKLTAEQAMEALGIAKSDYNKYINML